MVVFNRKKFCFTSIQLKSNDTLLKITSCKCPKGFSPEYKIFIISIKDMRIKGIF